MSADKPSEIIVFSESDPKAVSLFVRRLFQECPELNLLGIVFRGDSHSARHSLDFLNPKPGFLSQVGNALLSFLHACPSDPNGAEPDAWEELVQCGRQYGGVFQSVTSWEDIPSLAIAKNADSALGIVLGEIEEPARLLARMGKRILYSTIRGEPSLPEPTQSASANEKKKSDSVNVSVWVRAGAEGMDRPFRSQTFRIEPYDSAVSLYLKSNLISRDLMIEAVKELLGKPAESVVTEDRAANHAKAEGKSLGELMREASGSTFRPARERPAWKLLIRTVFFAPYVLLRNWMRRLRGGFPVVVLYHHVIADRPSHIGMSTEWFLKHANFLKRHYRIVSLSESLRLLRSGKVTAPTAVLTFDDGYRDNFINLRAVTERLDLPAMLFVSTEHISTGRLFQHDVIRNQLDFLPLTWDQIRFLHKSGFEIGGHTRIHFDCGSTDAKALEHEIVGCKTDLEMELKEPARFFSFPWGNRKNMSEVAVQIATGAFEHVFSAYGGANFPHAGKDFGEILRPAHANSLWELELTMQSILEF